MELLIDEEMSVQDALKKMYPDSSRRTLQNWLKAKRFTVDGQALLREDAKLQAGQVLCSQEHCKPSVKTNVPILYSDRYLIAIDKPIHLLSVPLDGGSSKKSALELLRQDFDSEEIVAVHRIDRETSGVLIFARGKKSAEKFNELFEKHDLKREYFAIVHGRLQETQGTWKCPLLELPNFQVIESDAGKMAITHFKVHRRSAKYSYLHLTLETGKKHQIRVHCQRVGHPIVGDQKYGASENPLKRLCLHAKSIEFVHPFTNKTLRIESALPKSFFALGGQI